MTAYDVYLEIAKNGACIAHVPGLPGCFAVGADRERGLARLEGEIGRYMADLIRHGDRDREPWLIMEEIELPVAEEQEERGAFHPDDRAALFSHDRRPLEAAEVERYLTLAEYNRTDLRALVRGLSDSMLDWRAGPEAMSIRRVLSHIGRADLWYISRVTEPSESGPDWRTAPGRRFLTQSRATVAEQFRALNDAELAAVTYPTTEGGDNSEAWTARKALRRLLEHEREHTAHIREILWSWREHLLARLAASRSAFIWQMVSLKEETIERAPLFASEGDAPWTAKDLLAHVGAWDELYAQRTSLAGQGKTEAIEGVDLEERNAMLAAARGDWSLDEAIGAFSLARDDYLVAIGGLPDADLHRRFRLPWGGKTTLATWARWRARHDDRHTKDLLAWRATAKPMAAVGPKSILRAALESGRLEMLATATMVPVAERETRPVCGVWTLKDVLGHVADWEWYGVEKLDGGPSRRSLDIRFRRIQDWNESHAAARQDQPWDEVWSDFQGARLAMGQLLEKMSQDDLAQPFAVPWSKKWTVYRWIHLWLHHEREHAADLRLNLDLPGWPGRLKNFE